MNRNILILVAISMAIFLIAGCFGITSPSASSKITKENYDKLQIGMSYRDAVATLGGEGKLLSSGNTMGYESEIYSWEGSYGSSITLMFQSGALFSKSQLGLGSDAQTVEKNVVEPTPPSKPIVPAPNPAQPSQPEQIPQSPSSEPQQAINRCDRQWYQETSAVFCNALEKNDSSLCEKMHELAITSGTDSPVCYAAMGACNKMKIDERPACLNTANAQGKEDVCTVAGWGADYCYAKLSSSPDPKSICASLSPENAIGCYFRVAFLKSDQTACSAMDSYFGNYYQAPNQDKRDSAISRCNSMFSEDASNCESESCKIPFSDACGDAEMCISKIALERNDESICEKYGSNSCYARLAISRKNESMCDNVGESLTNDKFGLSHVQNRWQDECYYQIAIAKNDRSICSKIQHEGFPRDSCLMQFALKEDGDQACSEMSNSHERDVCFLMKWFGIKKF